MFKIIYMEMPEDAPEEATFSMLPDRFDTHQEARDFLLSTEIPKVKEETIDGDSELAERTNFDVLDYGNEMLLEYYLDNDLYITTNYKIMEA